MATRRNKDKPTKLFRFTKAEELRMRMTVEEAALFMEKFGKAPRKPLPVTDLEEDDGYPSDMRFKQACEYLNVPANILTAAVHRCIVSPYSKEGERYQMFSKQELKANRDRIANIEINHRKQKYNP